MRKREHRSHTNIFWLWPIWVTLGFPLLLIAFAASPIAPDFLFVMIGIPCLWLVWVVSAVCAAILTVRWLWRRVWQRAAISAVLPFVVLAASLNFLAFTRFCNNAGDAVHFYVRYSAYANAVRATEQSEGPRLLIFNLGGMIWASRGFVYDESDEVLKEPSTQSAGWKARAKNSELGCGYGAIPMPGPSSFTQHWYIASFGC
jgi:hypothetical protein